MESHATFHLANCRVGAFSPLGDKIVVGNATGIFVINSYTYEVSNVISNAQMMGRVARNVEYVGELDMVVEVMYGGCHYYVEIGGYVNVRLLGYVQNTNNNNTTTNNNNTNNTNTNTTTNNNIILNNSSSNSINSLTTNLPNLNININAHQNTNNSNSNNSNISYSWQHSWVNNSKLIQVDPVRKILIQVMPSILLRFFSFASASSSS